MTVPATILVMAKAPIPGYAKTRLTPPLTPAQAARLAAAALLDTLDSVLDSGAAHPMTAISGDLSAADSSAEIAELLTRFDVVDQRGATFGARLANAHADAGLVGLPVLQIGMDTPHADPTLLADAARALCAGDGAAFLGPATDGGWWALGLPHPDGAAVLAEVPMSTSRTGRMTAAALRRSGYRVRELPSLSDFDTIADAHVVAAAGTARFAAAYAEIAAVTG